MIPSRSEENNVSFQLKIKHQGVEIEFSAQDLQQIASELLKKPEAAPKPAVKVSTPGGVKRRGRPPGAKNQPKLVEAA